MTSLRLRRFVRTTGLALPAVALAGALGSLGCFPPPSVQGSTTADAEIRAGDAPRQFRLTISANAAAREMGTSVDLFVGAHAGEDCTPGREVTFEMTLRRVDGTTESFERSADLCATSGHIGGSFDALALDTCGASGCTTAVDVFVERIDAETGTPWNGALVFSATMPNSDDHGDEELTVQAVAVPAPL
jgi:hypothetical protein